MMDEKIENIKPENNSPAEFAGIKIDSAKEEKEGLEIEEPDYGSKADKKSILILIGLIVGIFLLFIVGFKAYNHLTTATIINIDELHQENLQDQLDEEKGYVYNGYSFVKADGLWWTEMNKFGTLLKVPLHFSPREVEEISVSGNLDPGFNDGEEIYIAIDPLVQDKFYSLAISELGLNVAKGMDRIVVGSCTKENWACENRTIINCENAAGRPTIELSLEEETKIEAFGTCIKISGSGYDIVKAANKFLYQWYGIMD